MSEFYEKVAAIENELLKAVVFEITDNLECYLDSNICNLVFEQAETIVKDLFSNEAKEMLQCGIDCATANIIDAVANNKQ